MKFSHTLLALIGCLLFISAPGQKDEELSGYPCEQEAMLFAPYRNAPLLDARSPHSILDRTDSLSNMEDQDKCGVMMEYGMILKDGRKVRVNIKRECSEGPLDCFPAYDPFSIKLNRRGQVLADQEILDSMDSLSNRVKKGVKNAHARGEKLRVQVGLSDSVPPERSNKAFKEIVEGYQSWYQVISNERHLCELDPAEVRGLLEQTPFDIMLMPSVSTADKMDDREGLTIDDMDVDEDSKFDFEGKGSDGNAPSDKGIGKEELHGPEVHIEYTRSPCRVSLSPHHKDSCYLHISSDFDNDTITVQRGDSLVFRDTFSTEPSTGLADIRQVGSMHNEAPIKLRVNRGPWATVKPHPYSNVMLLEYFSREHASGFGSIYPGVTLSFKCEME